MIGAWLQRTPSARYVVPRKWRAWLLLAWTCTLVYELALQSVDFDWAHTILRVRGGMLYRTDIPLAQLGEVREISVLPSPIRRLSGYELAGRKRGSYELPGWGTVDLFLDAETPPYLLLPAHGNARSIVLNGCDADETHELFERLQREATEIRSRWLDGSKPAGGSR